VFTAGVAVTTKILFKQCLNTFRKRTLFLTDRTNSRICWLPIYVTHALWLNGTF